MTIVTILLLLFLTFADRASELAPARAALKPPRRSLKRWAHFLHLLARSYMDYERAVLKASRRRKNRAVDVDGQRSKQGTGWAFHWATLGKNKLHDPQREYGPNTRIDELLDVELERMRGPKGQKPHKLSAVLAMCWAHRVRAEVEAKVTFSPTYVRRLMARPYVRKLDKAGWLQVKTLAYIGAPAGPVARLRPWHDAGATTILSFTKFGKRKGISKAAAWPVVDFVRGRAKWTA